MPKVTRNTIRCWFIVLLLAANWRAAAQSTSANPDLKNPGGVLYQQLGSVGLDHTRVYRIRDASVDRAPLHVSLTDGTIAFTEDVEGRITGAFFEGEGEALLIPPNQIERSQMALFTGAAILEEKFVTAYLRFNDDTFTVLQPFLRPREDPEDFIAKWNDTARNLAQADALRLLVSFSRLLPVNGPSKAKGTSPEPDDRMLHLKVQGRSLGIFDLFFDLAAAEQISAGQLKRVDGEDYYDVWTSFAISRKSSSQAGSEIAGEEESQGEIEISSYKIEASIQLPTQLEAVTRLHLKVLRGGERAVSFELSRYLKIQKVEADRGAIEFIHNPALEGSKLARRGDDLVVVIFPQPLREGQEFDLSFSYGGAVLSDAGSGLIYVGERGTWYPNRGIAKALFDLEFHYPAGWTLIATGDRQEESAGMRANPEAAVPAFQSGRWISSVPIPVAGFNLGKYTRVTRHAGPVDVDVYAASGMERGFPQPPTEEVVPNPSVFRAPPRVSIDIPSLPPSPARNAQAVANNAAHAITFFAGRFGPYPYHQLAVTQMPGTLSQGWPGLIFLSSFSFLTPEQKLALHMNDVHRAISDLIIDHETAHEWWGDLVTWSGYRDQWISEGLASYSSLLLLESANPAQFHAILRKYRDDLLQKNKNGAALVDAGPVTLGPRLSSSKFHDGYETIAYERGTWLLHMLRTLMSQRSITPRKQPGGEVKRVSGDEAFLRALRTLSEQYQARPISTQELMRVFEKELPPSSRFEDKKSLDWFYQGWVNGTAIPTIELHGVKYSDTPGKTMVSGTIKQKDAPDTLITPVPIYAAIAGRNVPLGLVFADGPETQFHLAAPSGAHKILLDPEQSVLSHFH